MGLTVDPYIQSRELIGSEQRTRFLSKVNYRRDESAQRLTDNYLLGFGLPRLGLPEPGLDGGPLGRKSGGLHHA
jgi:hypothetical protein